MFYRLTNADFFHRVLATISMQPSYKELSSIYQLLHEELSGLKDVVSN